ncbi:MAG: M3 family metallopeptidase [Microthrixaceae bacterium]
MLTRFPTITHLLLNWTSRGRDVATLAHELGHGLHAYLSRDQGIFHQSTPLTLAETASVFGEAVTNNALLTRLEDPSARFALLASTLEDSIATVFRQVAMNRFEDAVHTSRREEGELSVDRFGELWVASQRAMLGDSVELSGVIRPGAPIPISSAHPDMSTPMPTDSFWPCRSMRDTSIAVPSSFPRTWNFYPPAVR